MCVCLGWRKSCTWPHLAARPSRETELAAEHPLHVVCAWIGNTTSIAAAHYLQVTDADFERAARGAAKSGAVEVQNAVQQPAAPFRTQLSELANHPCSMGDLQQNAEACELVRNAQVGTEGLEPPTPSV